MCAHPIALKKKQLTVLLYLTALLLAFLSTYPYFVAVQHLGLFLSEVFIKLFKCISLPIIALSLIVTLSQYNTSDHLKGIWQKALFYTISTTLLAATVSCLLYALIQPSSIELDLVSTVATAPPALLTEHSFYRHLLELIPSNIFSPFLEHQVISVLLLSILVGIAIRCIPEQTAKNTLTHFFKGTHGIFMVITAWIVKVLPLAFFGFVTTTLAQLQNGVDISGLAGYLTVILLANVIQGLLVLPVFLKLHHIAPFKALRGMLPALSIAFFSKSSTGTLPITMDTIEKNLGVSPKISKLVLPLCTSINMNGCAAFIFTTVLYVMQHYGADIGPSTMILWIFIASLAAIGNAGVPMGCFFLSASLLTSMNIPISLLGLILPFYSIIDMVETALNVWSDSCVTKVIDTSFKKRPTS